MIARRTWDGRCIIWMKSEPGGRYDRKFCIRCLRRAPTLPVKLQSKRSAECGKGSFGGIGLRRLERNIMYFAGRRPAAFARAMALANDY